MPTITLSTPASTYVAPATIALNAVATAPAGRQIASVDFYNGSTLLAHVTSADVVYDLGSGDGRIPITAAKKYGARGVGIEIDSFHNRDAIDNLARAGVGNRVRFLNQDLFEVNISEATVVTLFLLPRLNLQLIPKFRRELRPGARVVSHKFDMGNEWPPEQSRDVDGLMIYLWTIR